MGDKSPQKEQKDQKSQPRTGKGFTYEVVLLDGEHVNIELDKNADGKDLFDKVCQHLDLSEREYFGLQYVDERIPHPLKCWLSPDKKISKQKKRGPWLFDFALKFYPPDPTQLRESLTRWLVTLQTRRDILSGKLPATFLTQAMLGSYCVQADVGDYDSTEHHGIEYIKDIPFTANQTTDLLEKIVELHRQHKGQTPDEAEINYLENVKKLSMYGVDLHAAQDVNNVDIMIGVCASGLQVYRDKLRISRFVWPKILKISYKRNHFYIKVRPADNSRLENTVSFKLASHRLAKRLWKICVEHHAFFRLREAEQPNNAAMFPRLGSKFRYSGRTLYQARHSSQNLDRPDPYFERSQPARNTYAAPSNRSRSVDELTSRPDYWKDDLDTAGVQRRPMSEARDGRDKRDHMGQPTVISMLGLPEGMKPVESEEGTELEPGANRSMDGKDRLDRKPGDEDATLERAGMPGTMGLTPAELQKKAKEDEKERKKQEKEDEKKRKKDEEDRKKAEKAAKKGKGKDPTAEDRADVVGGGDATEKAPGRTPGSYADQEGEPIRFDVVAPVGISPIEKGKDPYGTAPEVEMRERSAPRRGDPENEDEDKDRFSTFKDPGGNERWSFRKSPNSPQDKRSPGKDKDGRSPGKDGDRFRFGPGRGSDRWSPDEDERGRYPTGRDGREPHSPGREGPGRDGEYRDLFAPAVYAREPYSPGSDKAGWEPGREVRGPYDPYGDRDGRSPGQGGDRNSRGPYGDRDGRSPGRDGDRNSRGPYGDRDGRSPGRGGDRNSRGPYGDRDGRSPGRDGDRNSRGPYGDRDGRSPGRDGDRNSRGPGEGGYRSLPPGAERDDGRYVGPEDNTLEADQGRWAPGAVPLDSDKKQRKDSDKDDDKDPKKKKHRKDSDKDDSKDGKKDKKKGKKDKKGADKDEDKKQKGADKDDDKKRKHKDSDKDDEKDKKKDKDGDKPGKDEKKGGLFGKFKKPKESKSKLPEVEDYSRPEHGPGEQGPGSWGHPDTADTAGEPKMDSCPSSPSSEEGGDDQTSRDSEVSESQQVAAYPSSKLGFAPGLGVGAGDMSGVVGEETWIDNKMTFQPVVPRKKENRNSLKSPRLSEIENTMPFFSPAATSTVGRPRSGKVPPPISPKPNNTSFDDSFSRRDPPTVATESVQYQPDLEEVPVPTKNVPLVKTETRTVTYEREGFPFDSEEDGVLVSACSHSTRMQTIETTTYKTEKDGVQETRVEHKVVLSSTDDDFDYDAALAEAIRSVTEFNPDMSVERIECVQQIEEVKDK